MAAKRMLDADVLEKRMRTLLLVLFLGAFPDMSTARARVVVLLRASEKKSV